MAYGKDEFVEFVGTIEASSSKAIMFCGEDWDKGEWLPRSQLEIVELDKDEYPARATIKVKKWLVEKNGWGS